MGGGGSSLRRQLKLVDVYAISTGAMFSSGLFLLPGIAFGQAGSWMILAYFLSAVLAVPAMLSKAELSSAMPRAGGTYYFLDRSMGPLMGTIGGLGTWIAMGLKTAFALIGMGAYLSLFLDVDITVVALILTGVFTLINIVGSAETARLQRWLVYALVGILVFFVIVGMVTLSGEGFVDRTLERLGSAPDTDIDGFLSTVGLVFISYAGLTKVCGVAEEVENPGRNILLGMVLSLGTAVVIYTSVAYVLVMVLDHQAMPTDLAPIATAAERIFDWMPGRLGVILAGTAALAAFASTANAGIMSASRYLLAMGRDDLIGRSFREVGRSGTPILALLTTGGFIALVLLALDVVSLAKLASAFQLLMFALVNLAVVVMRESRIEAYAPSVRSPLYPWMQLMGIFFSLGLIMELGQLSMIFTLALVAVGAAWFFVYAKVRVVRRGAILHWFERLGQGRFDDLEAELRTILREPSLHEGDPFPELIDQAHFVEMETSAQFPDVVRVAALRLADRVALDGPDIAEEFIIASRKGMVPLGHHAALLDLRVAGQKTHELVVVRTRGGVSTQFDGKRAVGEEPDRFWALFFLVSPEEKPAEGLRLLAKLASVIEEPDFMRSLLATSDPEALRELLRGGAVREFAHQISSALRADAPGVLAALDGFDSFQNILVVGNPGLDGEVIARAGHLAETSGARLTVVDLYEMPAGDGRLDAEAEATDGAARARVLEAAMAPLVARGVEVVAEVLPGKRSAEAIRAVLRGGHDLVILGADDGPGRLDSFAQDLLRKCPCPVWVMRPGKGKRLIKIAAAIAARPEDPSQYAVDARVLQIARRLADDEGGELHIVHAWKAPGLAMLGARAMTSHEESAERRSSYQDSARHQLSDVLDRQGLDSEQAKVHLIEGSPGEVIQRFAADEDIDLVVMGTTGRAGITGYFIGNTAEDVLLGIQCTVLAVKPPGFVTSVRI